MVMTSVSGHLLGYEFQGQYRSWNSCSPLELFETPVVKECPITFLDIKVSIFLTSIIYQFICSYFTKNKILLFFNYNYINVIYQLSKK